MKKDLIIPMEEECLTCPNLSLETHIYFGDSERILYHTCEHMEFCKAVRKNWEKYHERKEE